MPHYTVADVRTDLFQLGGFFLSRQADAAACLQGAQHLLALHVHAAIDDDARPDVTVQGPVLPIWRQHRGIRGKLRRAQGGCVHLMHGPGRGQRDEAGACPVNLTAVHVPTRGVIGHFVIAAFLDQPAFHFAGIDR